MGSNCCFQNYASTHTILFDSTMSDKHIVLYGIGWRGLLDVVLDQGKYFMRYYWANVVESDHSSDNDDLCGQNQPDIIDSAHIK